MAVAALVLGLIGLLAGIIPLLFFVAIPCGVLALVFGFVGRRRAVDQQAPGKGMATSGLVMGVLAVGLGVLGVVIIGSAVDKIGETIDSVLSTLPASLPESSTPETAPAPVGDSTVPSVSATEAVAPAKLTVESGFTPNPDRSVVSAGALVTNSGGRTACGVEVQFSLLNSAGVPVDTDTSTIPIIPAGKTVSVSPLQIGFQVPDPSQLQVSVLKTDNEIDTNSLEDCDGFYLEKGIEVAVLNPTLQRDFGSAVVGQLSNPSDETATLTQIACVFRLGGKIVGGGSSVSPDPIAPKGTIAFRIGLLSYTGEADEVLCSAMA